MILDFLAAFCAVISSSIKAFNVECNNVHDVINNKYNTMFQNVKLTKHNKIDDKYHTCTLYCYTK